LNYQHWDGGMDTETHRFTDDGRIPNSALPLLVYRQALSGADLAIAFERRFAENDWRGAWRNGIFDFHHFHSTSHEVLGIARSEGVVRFGGEGGESVALAAGNAVVIPAGVGHKLERASRDLTVVGAYPEGRHWDLRRGDPRERDEVVANLAEVPLPVLDPVEGPKGFLLGTWSGNDVR
jgi:uncharacterized protein YjlB